MRRYHSYIHSANEILLKYKGSEPFSAFIKKHFAVNKKFGGRDRKQITHICYCTFRLGNAFSKANIEERMLIALFLCSTEPNEMLQHLKPGWNEKVKLHFNEKLELINYPFSSNEIFPFSEELSNHIDPKAFALSHLIQPNLFLRIRPAYEKKIVSKLHEAGLAFQMENETCISITNAVKIDDVLGLNKEAVVQDYSSQRVGELIKKINDQRTSDAFSVWDCCAASGGKSIMAYDLLPGIQLTVSDIRESILVNLKKRFKEAGIKKYSSFVCDLSEPLNQVLNKSEQYDLVIADVPCSGSGTWGRTPEQLHFFDEKKVEEYVTLQRKIISNAIPFLKEGGYLLYITCSVFKKENEELISFIYEKFQLSLIEMNVLIGYEVKADTMFAALLKKN